MISALRRDIEKVAIAISDRAVKEATGVQSKVKSALALR